MNNENTQTKSEMDDTTKKKQNIVKVIFKISSTIVLIFILLMIWTYIQNSKNPLDSYPTKVKDVKKDDVIEAIDEFIDDRNELTQKAMEEFDKYIAALYNNEDYYNLVNLYNYGYIINIESNYKKDTDKMVRNYIKNNANGVYVTEQEEEKLDKKAEKIEEDVDKHKKYIKRKYKNIKLTDKILVKGSKIYNYFVNLKLAKDFIVNDLKQEDIDEAVIDYKYKVLTTNKLYSNTYEAKPILWENFVHKKYPTESLINYYFMNAFVFSTNIKYHKLNREVKSLVKKILNQSVHTTRYGYFNTKFTKLGINNYLQEYNIFSKIENMTDKAIKNIENLDISKDTYMILNQEVKYTSNEKITINKKNPEYYYEMLINTKTKKEPKTIKKTVKKYKEIILSRKVGTYKQGYTNKLISGYEVKYKEVQDKPSSSFEPNYYHIGIERYKVFKTLQEAKDFIKSTLRGKKVQ